MFRAHSLLGIPDQRTHFAMAARAFGPIVALALLTRGAVAEPRPVKIFILAGQSNMEGLAVADLDGEA